MLNHVAELRTSTRPLHQKLEDTQCALAIMNPLLQPAEYLELLKWWHRHWKVLEHLERRLRPDHADTLLIPQRRSAKAEADIQALAGLLNLPPDDNDYDSWPEPDIPGASGSWEGLAYVMKGSELGSKMIKKQLQTSLIGTPAINHLGFFDSAPDQPAWPVVIHRLEELLEQPLTRMQCIASANRIFEWLIRSAL